MATNLSAAGCECLPAETSQDDAEFNGLLLACLVVGLLILIVACGLITSRFVSYSQLLASNEERVVERVRAAIETTRTLHFTATFIRAVDFLALGELTPYETLRDRGLHVYRDRCEHVLAPVPRMLVGGDRCGAEMS